MLILLFDEEAEDKNYGVRFSSDKEIFKVLIFYLTFNIHTIHVTSAFYNSILSIFLLRYLITLGY